MQTRIYVVIHGEERRLVEASSAAQAIRHCVANKYAAHPASPKDIANFMSAGIVVERVAAGEVPPQSTSPSGQQTQATY